MENRKTKKYYFKGSVPLYNIHELLRRVPDDIIFKNGKYVRKKQKKNYPI